MMRQQDRPHHRVQDRTGQREAASSAVSEFHRQLVALVTTSDLVQAHLEAARDDADGRRATLEAEMLDCRILQIVRLRNELRAAERQFGHVPTTPPELLRQRENAA